MSLSGSIEGLGTKRIFGIHIGINQNPSKSSKLMNKKANEGINYLKIKYIIDYIIN